MEKKNLIDPFIPTRPNPILSIPEHPVYEDDERVWIKQDNPENLKICMDFFEATSDKYHCFSNYSVVDLMRMSPEAKFQIYELHRKDYQPHNLQSENSDSVKSLSPNKVSAKKEEAKISLEESVSTVRRKTPTPYEIMLKIIDYYNICFVNFDSTLYVYDNNHYRLLSYDSAITLLMDILKEEMPILGTTDFVSKVYSCLQRFPGIKKSMGDISSYVISLNNGNYNYFQKKFEYPSAKIFTPFHLNANYMSQHMQCPVFERFLYQASKGDGEWINRAWEIIGYCLSSDNNAKSIFVFQGKRDSGKSLLSALIGSFYPAETQVALDVHQLEKQFAPSQLAGKFLCVSPDLQSTPLSSTAISWLKRISGNDQITADVKYRPDMLTFRSCVRFILSTNHPLILNYSDPAFMRRLVVLPFFESISLEKQDKNLLSKIITEKDAIFQRALYHAEQLRNRNYIFLGDFPINMSECLSENGHYNFYEFCECDNSFDFIANFLSRTVDADKHGFIPTETLYKLYLSFGGALSKSNFSRICNEVGRNLFSMQKTKQRTDGFSSSVWGFQVIVLKNKLNQK